MAFRVATRNCDIVLLGTALRQFPTADFGAIPLIDNTMRAFGRFLQVVALVILPLAMGLQLGSLISPGVMLQMLVAGVCIFGIGWILMTYR
jgi:hypothetical protein